MQQILFGLLEITPPPALWCQNILTLMDSLFCLIGPCFHLVPDGAHPELSNPAGLLDFAFGNLPCPCVDTMASVHYWLLVFALRFPFGNCVVPSTSADSDISPHATLPHLSFSHPLRPSWLQLLLTQAHAFRWGLKTPSSSSWQPVLYTICCSQSSLVIQCGGCLEFPSSC